MKAYESLTKKLTFVQVIILVRVYHIIFIYRIIQEINKYLTVIERNNHERKNGTLKNSIDCYDTNLNEPKMYS